MEMKVWYDGVLKDVCGVNDKNTCQDVIIVLAQTASTTGSFTLSSLVDDMETPLLPQDRPCDILKRHGPDKQVQFILRRANENESMENMYKKLKNHLAYQEQEIESNRLRLNQMDQDILELQKGQLTSLTEEQIMHMISKQKEELEQLEKSKWFEHVTEYRLNCRALANEKASLDLRIKEFELSLQRARMTQSDLLKQISKISEMSRAASGMWF